MMYLVQQVIDATFASKRCVFSSQPTICRDCNQKLQKLKVAVIATIKCTTVAVWLQRFAVYAEVTCISAFLFLLKIQHHTANICNKSATTVQFIVAKTATFSFCNFWLQSLQIVGCKVNMQLIGANVASITCCTQ